jgi:hypothetical protein
VLTLVLLHQRSGRKSRPANKPTHNVKIVVLRLLVVLRGNIYLTRFYNERNMFNEGTTRAPSRDASGDLVGP